MADILLLSPATRATERVRRAVQVERAGGVLHTLYTAGSWRDLFELASRSSFGMAFVDPYHSSHFAAGEIQRLRVRFPSLELIAYADFTGKPPGHPFTLARLGVRAVIPLEVGDDSAVIRQCLTEHLNWTPFEELVCRFGGLVPAHVLRWLEPVLRSAITPRTVTEFADLAHCSPRTLRRTLRAAGLPSPEQILAWRRLLHAGRLMEDTHRSVDSVARALEYSSGSALRKSLKRMTGMRPTEVARGGGLRLLAELFLRECRPSLVGGRTGLPEPTCTAAGHTGPVLPQRPETGESDAQLPDCHQHERRDHQAAG